MKDIIVKCNIFDDPELGPDTIDVWEGVRKHEGKEATKKYDIEDFNVLSFSENQATVRVTLKEVEQDG